MSEYQKYCDYLYQSLYMPVYLYADDELIVCYPKSEITPPSSYLSQLWKAELDVTYAITSYYTCYGCVRIENSTYRIVIGPVSNLPYTKDILNAMIKEHAFERSKTEEFFSFFYNIPTENFDKFIQSLLFVNYTLNRTEITKSDLDPNDYQLTHLILQNYSKNTFIVKEEGLFNNNYQIEKDFFHLIETGNMEELKKFSEKTIYIGQHADNNLRNAKNNFIIAATLSTRAAIKGGLAPSLAYQISDSYILQVERLTDIIAIGALFGQLFYDFTNRTANSYLSPDADNVLREVVTYVRENVNRNITVIDVAKHVGYNRSYLSRKVKSALGLDLSAFIRQSKLEEAKELLAHSDKSISEISSFLCFSSQSHFQRAFKAQYGITPHSYRRFV